MENKEHLITIKRFTSIPEALLVKGELESCDIQSFVQDQHLIAMNFWYSQAIGGIKLQVFKSDYDLAQKILSDESKISVDENIQKDQCPECDSDDVIYDKYKNWKGRGFFSTVTFFLCGLPLIFKSRYYHCESCSHCWK